jgi:Raf kinase inhibitor-like YbhB/YbcL family protein
MESRSMNRRALVGRGAAIGLGVAGLGAAAREALAAQATPVASPQPTAGCDPLALLPVVPSFTLTSTDVRDGEQMPKAQLGSSAGGQDQSPQLAWSGFPSATSSFCVTMYDADAPTGSGLWHWAVVDIPGNVTELPAGAGAAGDAKLPAGAFQMPNDLRMAQYLGAAPPAGTHRYYIVVTAVDVPSIGIDKNATPAVLGFMLLSHTLARAVLIPIASAG